GRQARRLRGTLEVSFEGRGSLQAPVLTARARTASLAAGETALGKAEVEIDYQQARTRLRSALASINGGTLEVDGTADLDLSYPAIRRGLKAAAAPIQAKAVARHFDLAFLTGFTSGVHKVAGTLEMDARASGTVGQPQAQGQLEWKDGTLGLASYGEYRRMHLLASATNDRISIEDLEAHSESGSLKLNALGTRGGPLWTLKASAEANAFPVFNEDQLVATLTLRTEATGTARAGHIELSKVQVPEAHVELPAQSRRDLQDLRRPDDIVLLRNGKPLDPKKARAILARDRDAEAAMGGSGLPVDQSKPLELVVVLDAPRNLWVKGQDLNVEVGLSPDFRVETGEETELFGEVRIIRGRLDVLGRRFDFQRNSLVRFAGSPTEPALNVTALYNNVKAGVKVSMQVQGQAGSMTLVPSSEPPLTESEIYTLLATGRTTLKRGSGGSEIGTAQAVSVLGSLAASQLKNAVDDKVGLDVLSIEAGDKGTLQGATLEAGKYVTDELYLGYAGKVGADPTRYENANAFRLEYQFLPRWSLEAVYGDAKSGSADIVWSRDY
ncbi:MAG TPA: translocation/assembly module TamB domain-containing protein, partial [Myxococcaceae bacterium]|nr:translocation/assembly module TamB domain-containing protein [Myxococcaceae bacterium]